MDIRSIEFSVSNSDVRQCPRGNHPEYAFIGRSNVGKSSLINMLARRKGLAKTSSKPGKTVLINHFWVNGQWYLVDLPGYGYALQSKSVRDKLKKLIDSYILFREQLTSLFVLIDSRLPPQQIDLDFMQWLGESRVPFSIVFTKKDKLSKSQFAARVDAYRESLSVVWEELPPMFFTSSLTGEGRQELLDYIDEVNRQLGG